MSQYETLKKRRDFLSISKAGERIFGKYFLMQKLCDNVEPKKFRVGYVATRKIGNAVNRNKAKRRLRSLVGYYQDQFIKGQDYVMIARKTLIDCDFKELKVDFEGVLRRVRGVGA